MATFGSIGEFSIHKESWENYVDRLGQYFEANEITDAGRQRAILNSVVGPATYQLITRLLAPVKPKDASFDDISAAMQSHACPKPSAIVERTKFYNRYRRDGETVADFMAELRGIAQRCDFKDKLSEHLRDRLVSGIRNDRVQHILLGFGDKLDLAKALETAQNMELASQQVKDLSSQSQPRQVHTVGSTNTHNSRNQRRSRRPHQTRGAGAPQQARPPTASTRTCIRCGNTGHEPPQCWAKELKCNKCSKIGHISRVCCSGRQSTRTGAGGSSINVVSTPPAPSDSHSGATTSTSAPAAAAALDTEVYAMYNHTASRPAMDPLIVQVQIDNKDVNMQMDTGASISIVSEECYNANWDAESLPLTPSRCVLNTYTQQRIPVLGECVVTVNHNGQQAKLPLIIVKGNGPNLLGRDWMREIKIAWASVFHVSSKHADQLMDRHAPLFAGDLGKLKGCAAHIDIENNAKPKFCKARPVPFALKERVEAELNRLHATGVIEPITFSRWAAPIVPIVKSTGDIRICGDYKSTVNQVATPDKYPLPRVDELFASLSGGKLFTKLDLSHAYNQIELDEVSQEYVTVNTHKGLYRYNRLPFGVSAAPSIFQRTIDSLVAGIPNVVAFLDDLLITGSNEAAHWANVETVLQKLEDAGLRLKREKCVFGASEVVYLGHRINADGLQPTKEKVEAVVKAPSPRDMTELKSYLGLINYYGKFLPNLSSLLAPLHLLMRKDTQWAWGDAQQEAFEESKELLTSAKVLVHFDPNLDLIVSCDASPYGVGAVLAHRMPDGSERPIAYASRTLSPAEKNYSHLDKEGVAIIFGVKKFHQFVYGRQFDITTDHKPLLGLFGEARQVPPMASSRLQRWSLTLSAYQYRLIYRPGAENGNADCLSRLPLLTTPSHTPEPQDYVLVMDHLESTAVSPDKIRLWTARDPGLFQVSKYIAEGWPQVVTSAEIKPFFQRRTELSLHQGVIMWGSRVVIPPQGRPFLMEELHETHPGMARMKALARSYVWWPHLDMELENKVKGCNECQRTQKAPPVAPLHPWEFPKKPWSRLHIDYAGPFMGHMFLIIVDAHSKWLDVHPMHTATTQATVEKLRITFATHGLPDIIVSDNGTNFTSAEFADFVKSNGIKHVRSAPFHPSSNGLAERAVQTFKYAMKRMTDDNASVVTKVARFLMRYRITPHTTTGLSPAQVLMNRQPQSRLDLVRPNMERRVVQKQLDQKVNHDMHSKQRDFNVGDLVYTRNFAHGPKWTPGQVIFTRGPLSYDIELTDGRIWKRHVDHVRGRVDKTPDDPNPDQVDDFLPAFGLEREEDQAPGQLVAPAPAPGREQQAAPVQRASIRDKRPPNRYGWD